MPRRSAGLLLYRVGKRGLEVLLGHPGGPFWVRKDLGAWSIPKGEIEENEDGLAAAQREFREETGHAPAGQFLPMTPLKQKGGKIVHAWAVQGDWDPAQLRSSTFQMEYPGKSGRFREFPELDRAAWFTLEEARTRMLESQRPLLNELEQLLGPQRS